MFGRKVNIAAQLIEKAKHKLLDEMDTYSPGDPEFKVALDQLERLEKLPSKDKKTIDPNTLLLVAGNLLGILVIVAYEQKHVFTSKGLNFIK